MQLYRLKREDFAYQTAYCEENIWHLCQQNHFQNSYVIFIFSKGGAFPMLKQHVCTMFSIYIQQLYYSKLV